MPVTVQVDDKGARVALGELRADVTDVRPLLGIAAELMRGSVARTFRDEGSPAGSWPRLALSTLRKKGYTSGHKLLIMSGRLFGSFTYWIDGNTLTMGTNVPYAGVQQFGSADRGIGEGPQARISGRDVGVRAHDATRSFVRYARERRMGKDGRIRTVRVRADKTVNVHVGAHRRFQNIPARPFLVFRPEDPARIAEAFAAYLSGKMVNPAGVRFLRSAGGAL